MDLIKAFLAKYENLKPADDDRKEAVKETIFKYAGMEINKSNIVFRGYQVIIQASPAVKLTIQMKKTKILKELGLILDKRSPKDIL